jgi:hypothetical protein
MRRMLTLEEWVISLRGRQIIIHSPDVRTTPDLAMALSGRDHVHDWYEQIDTLTARKKGW